MHTAEQVIQQLELATPGAVRLAEAVSLAARIEPDLLRAARLELLAPQVDVSAEADLWFSNLVLSRSPVGIVFKPDVAAVLRQRLADDQKRLEAAWRIIEQMHRDLSPAVLLEEKIAWFALSGNSQGVQSLLRTAVATLVVRSERGLAFWAARAYPRLPDAARESEEGQMLALGTSLWLGRAHHLLKETFLSTRPDWVSWLSPANIPRRSIGVRLVEQGIEFGPTSLEGCHRIELPDTDPLLLDLAWKEEPLESRTQRVVLKAGKNQMIEVGQGEIELTTLAGERYIIAPDTIAMKKLERVRRPHVQITYDIAVGDAIEKRELPFVVGVLADLNGKRDKPLPKLGHRKFVEIDRSNFDEVMKGFQPHLSLRVENRDAERSRTEIDLKFNSLDDFSPEGILNQIEPLHRLLGVRKRLSSLLQTCQENSTLVQELMTILTHPDVMQSIALLTILAQHKL